jgi:hypothetical protein
MKHSFEEILHIGTKYGIMAMETAAHPKQISATE